MFNIGTFFSKVGFWGRKHSPELLIAGGIISAASSVALAIYSTTRLNKVIEPYNKKIDSIKADLKDDNKIQNKEIDIKESKKQLAVAYGYVALKIAALYAPSALFFISSVGCILGSHKIMKTRNLALAAACTTLEQSYQAYRKRVKDKLGEEVEEKIYKDIYKDEVEVTDPNTGKTKVKKMDVPHINENNAWNVIYDCGNTCWERDALMNFDWLMLQQDYYNEKLRRQGYLFLYDIYKDFGYTTSMLGEEKARASRILGWIYDPTNPKRNCYISFGLTQPGTRVPLPKIAEQIQRNEAAFWLNLNPDGDILSGEYGKETFMKFAKEVG